MNQNDDEPPPFWLQTTTTFNHLNNHRHRRRNHRNPASVFLNTGVLVTFLLVAAILFMFILVPYVLSLARQVFNPKLVKSSWSSLNIVLVLFAILCGFLGRREDDQNTPVNTPKTAKSGLYGDQDRVGFTGLRRSSSSYPDLRQESSKWRFYDDTDVEILHFRRSDSGFSQPRSFKKSDDGNNFVEIKNVEVNDKNDVVDESKSDSPSPSVVDENVDEDKDGDELVEIPTNVEEIVNDEIVNNEIEDESSSKNVEVGSLDSVDETKVELSQESQPSQTPPESPLMKLFPPPSPTSYFWPSPSPPPPPPPPPPPTWRVQAKVLPKKEANQTFETIGYGRYKWNNNTNTKSNAELPPQSSTSTPKPRSKPVVVAHYSESKQQSSERKKGGVAVTKDFFTSFYNQSKKKRKHKRRSYENLEEFIEPAPKVSIHRSKSTPEFPPPSPPPPPPPPPPPQPQHSVFNTLFSKKGKTKKKVHSISTNSTPPTPPPPPKKQVKKTVSKNIAVQGDESPLRPIPTPPPPPPFKLKPWQFVMQGDYVNIESNNNSPRSGYSASEDESSISPGTVKKSEIPKSPLFCPPSPDVNTKADDFIAMFRAKLTLEKSDSISLKQGNAGPSRFNLES